MSHILVSALLVAETGVHGENQIPVASHWAGIDLTTWVVIDNLIDKLLIDAEKKPSLYIQIFYSMIPDKLTYVVILVKLTMSGMTSSCKLKNHKISTNWRNKDKLNLYSLHLKLTNSLMPEIFWHIFTYFFPTILWRLWFHRLNEYQGYHQK